MGMGLKAGVPNILIILDTGRCVFVELKAKGNTPNGNQLEWHGTLRRLGCDVHVLTASDPSDAVDQMSDLLESCGVPIPAGYRGVRMAWRAELSSSGRAARWT